MKKSIKICMIAALVLFALLIGMIIFYFAATAGAKLDTKKLNLSSAAMHIFDKNANPVFEEFTSETVPLSSLPKYVPLSFVAVEDKRFFEHNGLDFRRIIKASAKNIASFSFKEGASTITQQLIKNTHLSSKKTLIRKLKEMKLARKLEKLYTKEQILELYLNTIYFGHSAFGIENASRFYFGKSARELLPEESALLAALVKSPNRYSPFKDEKKCLARRDFVLLLMKEQNILSKEEYERAKLSPLPASSSSPKKQSAYLSLVLKEIEEILPEKNFEGGIFVYTYLDKELQTMLEEKIPREYDMTTLIRENNNFGGIKAFYSTYEPMTRLPASTIKPLAVYAPAIEEDLISPATPILDEKIDFKGYSPKNSSGKFEGYMSARYALAHSVNVPAVKTLNALGLKKAEKYLNKMNLPLCDEDKTLALALGGMKEGYTLKALADAYATFAQEGYYSSSFCIRRILSADGKVLFEAGSSKGEQVFSKETSSLMCDMLHSAVLEGTAKKLKSLPFFVCAKTGTAEREGENTDAYTIAYTYEDTVAVWLGNRDFTPIKETGGGAAANEALRILKGLYKERAPKEFPLSENVVEVALDREEYEENHRLLLMDPTAPDYLALHELFKKSAVPAGVSTKFQSPKIQKPRILVKNAAVEIILCQTYYYDYVVKRESDGEILTIYSGSYRKNIVDNSVRAGKKYTYTVTPYYQGIEGESVTLPSVFVEESNSLPDNWWEDEI